MSDLTSTPTDIFNALPFDPLRVNYEFNTPNFGEVVWEVLEIELHEKINEPYLGTVFVLQKNLSMDPADLVGADCELIIHREPIQKKTCGIIREATFVHSQIDQTFIRITFAPAFDFLKHQKQSRIFQDMTVPEIIKESLGAALKKYDRKVATNLLHTEPPTTKYTTREYTTQYNETDFAFFSRLMQEEGISYHFFSREKEKELMILTDENSAAIPPSLVMGDKTPYFNHHADHSGTEHVHHFSIHQNTTPTSIEIIEHEWTKNGTEKTKIQSQDEHQREREIFLHDRNFNLGNYNDDHQKYQIQDQEHKNQIRLNSLEINKTIFSGNSNVIRLTPVTKLEMEGHPKLDGSYFVLAVEHHSKPLDRHSEIEIKPEKDDSSQRYMNHFICIPLKNEYYPQVSIPKPTVQGVLTATVVGPEGEEIHTDEHGRVKVQFHWDREGKHNDHSSCWVRVMQGWAGQGWGCIFLPRIGMEVIVTFVEGDPDKPLITGCVYNGENRPPYSLPEEKTKSTIRSKSSIGSDGFNEFRFEDAKNKEEIFIHAQKDMVQKIKNDRTLTIGHDETHTVKNDQTITIENNKTTTVHKNQKSTIKETLNVDIGSNNHKHKVRINETMNIELTKELVLQAKDKITFQCGDSAIVMTPKDIKLLAVGKDKGAHITLNEKAAIQSKDKSTAILDANIQLENSKEKTIAITDEKILAKADEVTIEGSTKATLKTGGDYVETKSGTVTIQGKETNINS